MNLQLVPKYKKYNKTLSQVFFVSVPPPRYRKSSYDNARELPVPITVRPYKPKKHKDHIRLRPTIRAFGPVQNKGFFGKRRDSYDVSETGCGWSRWCAKKRALRQIQQEQKRKEKQAKNLFNWKFEEAERLRHAEIEEARLKREAEYAKQIYEIERVKRQMAKDRLKTHYPPKHLIQEPYTEFIDLTHEDTHVIKSPPQRQNRLFSRQRKEKLHKENKEKPIKLKRQKNVFDLPHKCRCNLAKLKKFVTTKRKKKDIIPISDSYEAIKRTRLKEKKTRLKEEKTRLKEEKRRIKEEKKHLKKENKRLKKEEKVKETYKSKPVAKTYQPYYVPEEKTRLKEEKRRIKEEKRRINEEKKILKKENKRFKKEEKVKETYKSKPVAETYQPHDVPVHDYEYKPKNYDYNYTPTKFEDDYTRYYAPSKHEYDYKPTKYEEQPTTSYNSDPYRSYYETENVKPKQKSKKEGKISKKKKEPYVEKVKKPRKIKSEQRYKEKCVNIDKRPPPVPLSQKFVNCFYRTCCECCCWFSVFVIVGVAVLVYV